MMMGTAYYSISDLKQKINQGALMHLEQVDLLYIFIPKNVNK